MKMRLLTQWIASAALCASAGMANGSCPAHHEAVGQRQFNQAGSTYKVYLCWRPQATATAAGGSLLLTAYLGDQVAAQATTPLDVEGQVRSVRFDRATYALNEKVPVFPVLVEARLRGATFDQYSTDLMLFALEGKDLKNVLSQNIAWEAWGTQCEPDCIDTTKTKTAVIIAPERSAQGLHDLKLRTRGTTTAFGKPGAAAEVVDKTVRYIFNGQMYEGME
jgi:hypothetical protein